MTHVLAAILALVSTDGLLTGASRDARDYLLAELRVNRGVGPVAFLPNGRVLVFCSFDEDSGKYVLTVWNFGTKKIINTIPTALESPLCWLDVSPNGRTILAADFNGKTELYTTGGKLVTAFRVFEFGGNGAVDTIKDIRFLNDDEVLTIPWANVAHRRFIGSRESKMYWLPGRALQGATVSPKADILVWTNDRFVNVWSPMLRAEVRVDMIQATGNRYCHVACAENGRRAACATDKSMVGLVDLHARRHLKTWDAHGGRTLAGMFFLTADAGLVTASEAGDISCWTWNGQRAGTLELANEERIVKIGRNTTSTVIAVSTEERILVLDLSRIRKDFTKK